MKTVSLSVSKPSSGKGSAPPNLVQNLREQHLLANHQRRKFRPTGSNVGQRQRLQVATLRTRPAVEDEIRFHVAGRRIIPVVEGPHRHGASHGLQLHFRRRNAAVRVNYDVRSAPWRRGSFFKSSIACSSCAW